MSLSKLELTLISNCLEMASDEFSNHGCNDMQLANTDENWQLIEDMEEWNGTDPQDKLQRPSLDKPIYTYDWYVMRYLASRATEETEP